MDDKTEKVLELGKLDGRADLADAILDGTIFFYSG
jgi:hypothetical protein